MGYTERLSSEIIGQGDKYSARVFDSTWLDFLGVVLHPLQTAGDIQRGRFEARDTYAIFRDGTFVGYFAGTPEALLAQLYEFNFDKVKSQTKK